MENRRSPFTPLFASHCLNFDLSQIWQTHQIRQDGFRELWFHWRNLLFAGRRCRVTMKPWMTASKLCQINCHMTSWWVMTLFKIQRKGENSKIHKSSLLYTFYSFICVCSTCLIWPVSLFFSFFLRSVFPHVQVPFGPLAFMPGKLVHTNEVTVLLGDNWFTKCSAKQAQKIVDHRMKCEYFP